MEELKQWMDESAYTVIFTGAGISTDSGIPDFRSPGGLWSRLAPIDFRDFMASDEMRVETWRRKILLDQEIGKPEPNKAHSVISQLVGEGKVHKVITQNIDNLHQKSGLSADKVIELHGNGTFAKCTSCNKQYQIDVIKEQFKRDNLAPVCACGGYIKSATVSFGQSMPPEAMQAAEEASLACELFIAVGSSLKVFPAAGFPLLAKQNGAKFVIVNRDETDLDGYADMILNNEISDVFAFLTEN
ncbi:hypothetical protein IMCC14465_01850 [alpha proteobacterium IMCC14465]|uniref:protein acetyllysine N-acetyltransferase n=1 Tax=alpha proteobacterium IMCC14465 TaxID=1220535 RepID=J9DIQ5_9PROT|nr:hypothetical protein IMCC14465_01850 [alpha proteobacterium IMCC14465]